MSLTEQRPTAGGTRTFVVGAYSTRKPKPAAVPATPDEFAAVRDPQARIDEAVGLARAIDLEVVRPIVVGLDAVRPATYLGKGRVEEIAQAVKDDDVGLVVMDCALSPVQQRNLERAWGVKVIDRTGLILEIFGSRAHTREGTLQVELAHLSYQKSRLVRSWTHLERQRGGFGFLGGPGETQIEADRRIIQERMTRIEQDLEAVKRTRSLHRASRRRVPYPVVALVGYTNAGKSSLFNRLSAAEVMAEDMLFATLDPTARSVTLPHGGKAILSDTVGFISDLPTMLVAAFRATLEDVIEADVLLHVRDVSHTDTLSQAADVNAILRELGIDPDGGARIIEVWNKADLLDEGERERLLNVAEGRPADQRPVLVSALTGEGLDRLLATIEDRIARGRGVFLVSLEPEDAGLANWLHEETEVLERRTDDNGRLSIVVRVAPEKEPRLLNRFRGARQIR
ncbi:GTP-binding protein HflX [Pseudochelatococcus lubricantis]|uniref:GTPase HflX n=1 Tax=Pseudochelatococcus lubricantis TaxID=1538102 RepID=A0ABX0UXX3_9HYPH|nr:GTPase HflX [Pseudochelatococcus lubricantis]NIJ57799.1 GTP-binding protein HflX [Pseudochelatococcus lubricantis]